jgi:hypothetical protein
MRQARLVSLIQSGDNSAKLRKSLAEAKELQPLLLPTRLVGVAQEAHWKQNCCNARISWVKHPLIADGMLAWANDDSLGFAPSQFQ